MRSLRFDLFLSSIAVIATACVAVRAADTYHETSSGPGAYLTSSGSRVDEATGAYAYGYLSVLGYEESTHGQGGAPAIVDGGYISYSYSAYDPISDTYMGQVCETFEILEFTAQNLNWARVRARLQIAEFRYDPATGESTSERYPVELEVLFTGEGAISRSKTSNSFQDETQLYVFKSSGKTRAASVDVAAEGLTFFMDNLYSTIDNGKRSLTIVASLDSHDTPFA